MHDEPSPYEVLGVAPSADHAEIKAAYRRLSRRTHPDAGGTDALFRQVTEAYEAAMSNGDRGWVGEPGSDRRPPPPGGAASNHRPPPPGGAAWNRYPPPPGGPRWRPPPPPPPPGPVGREPRHALGWAIALGLAQELIRARRARRR